jgi:hypothetical protein
MEENKKEMPSGEPANKIETPSPPQVMNPSAPPHTRKEKNKNGKNNQKSEGNQRELAPNEEL